MKKLAALCVALLLALLFSRSPTSIAMAAYLTPGPAAFSGHAVGEDKGQEQEEEKQKPEQRQ
jgi:hypothetical protein